MAVDKGAVLSACGLYRYYLYRSWDATLPRMGIVMLNPSTADAEVDDPTIRRVVSFAEDFGFGRVDVCNLFAYRATEPDELLTVLSPDHEPGNPHANTTALRMMCDHVDKIVIAWGNPEIASIRGAGKGAIKMMREWWGKKVYALKINKGGEPGHPLYLPGDSTLIEYTGEHP